MIGMTFGLSVDAQDQRSPRVGRDMTVAILEVAENPIRLSRRGLVSRKSLEDCHGRRRQRRFTGEAQALNLHLFTRDREYAALQVDLIPTRFKNIVGTACGQDRKKKSSGAASRPPHELPAESRHLLRFQIRHVRPLRAGRRRRKQVAERAAQRSRVIHQWNFLKRHTPVIGALDFSDALFRNAAHREPLRLKLCGYVLRGELLRVLGEEFLPHVIIDPSLGLFDVGHAAAIIPTAASILGPQEVQEQPIDGIGRFTF